MRTAIELLNEGKAALSEVTDEYELDAWYLFEHATGIARHEYLMDSQATVPDEKCNIFREYISKNKKGDVKKCKRKITNQTSTI